jgi:hypothetical protein
VQEQREGKGLDGVADRVPVVEDAPDAVLVGVHHDDFGLHLGRSVHDLAEQPLLSVVEDAVHVGLEQLEQLRVPDDAGLDDLGEPVAELALRQGLEERQVDVDGLGVVERADEVLARRRVESGLACSSRCECAQ